MEHKGKKVKFDSEVKILYMHVWSYAYHKARKSNWMQIAADRYRFNMRRERVEALLTEIRFFSRQMLKK